MTGEVLPAPDLISAIDAMTRAVAGTGPETRGLLLSCRQCRNSLVYLLDTEQYRGGYGYMFGHRLRATPENHRSHSGPGSADWNRPVIRGVTS
jgi:hypothetical protein